MEERTNLTTDFRDFTDARKDYGKPGKHTPRNDANPESKKRPVVHSLAFSIFDTWVWKTGNTAICDYPGPLDP
jgi:hypothetical protein